jgi:hypothetical protein
MRIYLWSNASVGGMYARVSSQAPDAGKPGSADVARKVHNYSHNHTEMLPAVCAQKTVKN